MTNADTVRAIYAAFARGDVPAILERLAENVDWDFAYPTDHPVPWLRRRHGRAGAAAFFQSAGENLDFKRFEVPHLLADGALVIALATLEAVVRSTGAVLRETEEPHVWHFDSRGQVVRFRHGADTWHHWKANGG